MIELIAVIFSLLSVYFTVKNNVVAWPLGIVGIIFYGLYFNNIGIIGNVYLQFLFFAQSIYGWYNWKKNEIKITSLSKSNSVNYVILTLISLVILYFILTFVDSSFTVFDTLTTSISITAMFLLSLRKIQTWYYWITVDFLYIIFFIYIGSYLSAATYSIFLILAIIGLKQWYIKIN